MARFPVLRSERSITAAGTAEPINPNILGGLASAQARFADAAAGVGESILRIARRQETAEETSFVSQVTAEGQRDFTARFLQAQEEATGNASGFSERIEAEFDAMVESALENAPSDDARDVAFARFDGLKTRFVDDALRFEASMRRAEQTVQFDINISALEQSVFTRPDGFGDALRQARDDLAAAAKTHLTPDAARAFRQEIPSRLAEAALRGRIALDPEGTLAVLRPDAELTDAMVANLPVGTRQSLITVAEGAVKDLEAERKAARKERETQLQDARARQAAELEVAVSRGVAGYAEVNQARAAGVIKPAKWAQLTKAVDVKLAEGAAQQDRLALVAATLDGTVALDPKDGSKGGHRDAVNDYFNQVTLPGVQDLEPDAATTELIGFIDRVGMVPDDLQGLIRGRLRNGDAAQKAAAADMVARIDETNPAALQDFANEDLTVAHLINKNRSRGVEAERAVQLAEDAVFNADDPTRQVRADRFRTERLAAGAFTWFEDKAEGGVLGFGEAVIPDALRGEFLAGVEGEYLRGGDMEVARETVMADLKRVWAVTEVDGNRRWMKFAPEAVYGNGLDPKWMREQLFKDLRAGGLFSGDIEGRIRLEADPATARAEKPSYIVLLQDQDGVWAPMIDPSSADGIVRWRPDFIESPEYARALKKARELARETRREAESRRETADTPEVPN